jgi:acetyl esterase/lipase
VPSLRHHVLVRVIPRLRHAAEVDDADRVRRDLLAAQRQADPSPPRRVAATLDVRRGERGGLPCFDLTVRGASPARTVVYLHGGGYVGGLDRAQWTYAARLVRGLGVRVVLPDYPLAPTHTWRDSLTPVADLVQQVGAASPAGVVLVGDSAGGGLATAVAQELVRRGGSPLTHLVLFSPFVDVTGDTPGTEAMRQADPWLRLSKVRLYGGWWGGGDPADPHASPLFGDLAGLPPMLVLCGTRDLLLPQVRELVRRVRVAGGDVDYVEAPGLLHVYPLLPVPEARDAWRRVRAFL